MKTFETPITWFKCEDKMPERNIPILIKNKDGIFTAALCPRGWSGIDDDFHFLPPPYVAYKGDTSEVTHWAYLPQFEMLKI